MDKLITVELRVKIRAQVPDHVDLKNLYIRDLNKAQVVEFCESSHPYEILSWDTVKAEKVSA